MRKEIIIAIFVGVVLGGIFTYGIRRANLAYKPSDNISQTEEIVTNENDFDNQTISSLSLLSPEQNDVYLENTVTVTGITKPKSTVVISAEDDDFVLTSDNSGEFTQEIELIGGLNSILVKVFSKTKTIGEKTLNVVYTTKIDI